MLETRADKRASFIWRIYLPVIFFMYGLLLGIPLMFKLHTIFIILFRNCIFPAGKTTSANGWLLCLFSFQCFVYVSSATKPLLKSPQCNKSILYKLSCYCFRNRSIHMKKEMEQAVQ